MEKLERRFVEVRASAEEPKIEGYAIRTGVESVDFGGWREIISPDVEILWDDVRSLFNHDNNFVLGRLSSGTLKLERDSSGLRQVVEPPDTQWARDLLASMRRGDIDQQSFAFRVVSFPDGRPGSVWGMSEGGYELRTIQRMKIYDVSVVTQPAYEATDAQVRSFTEILAERPQARGPEPLAWQVELDLFQKRADVLGKMAGVRR